MKKILATLSLAAVFLTNGASAIEMRPVMTLDMAKKMIAACEAHAIQQGWKLNIAVMDAGANLISFERMDNAYLKSIDIAILKAKTSAGFPFSTKVLAELAATRLPGIAHVPGVATFEGGLPVKTADGVHIGSIGVSGARGDEDAMCAQVGIDAIADDLK